MRSSVFHLRTFLEAPASSPASPSQPQALRRLILPATQRPGRPSLRCLPGGTGRCCCSGNLGQRLSTAIPWQERRLTVIQVEEGKPAPREEGPLSAAGLLHLGVRLDRVLDGGGLTIQPVPAPQAAVQTWVHLVRQRPRQLPWYPPVLRALLVTHVAIRRPREWTLLRAAILPWIIRGPSPTPACARSPSAGRRGRPVPSAGRHGRPVPLSWQARGAAYHLEGPGRGRAHACASSQAPNTAPAQPHLHSSEPGRASPASSGKPGGPSGCGQPSALGVGGTCCDIAPTWSLQRCGLLSPARCGNPTRSQGLAGGERDKTLRNDQHRPLIRSYFPTGTPTASTTQNVLGDCPQRSVKNKFIVLL